MGNANSNPVRNLDKRSVRRIYRKNFKRHISAYVLEGDLEKQISSFEEELAEEKESKEMVQDRGIYVYVRKRPIFDRERKTKEFDVVSCLNQFLTVHDARMEADMMTQVLHNYIFKFDHVFDETSDNREVYVNAAEPMVDFAMDGGFATCLMYGQTGSGKTYTMSSIYENAAKDIFEKKTDAQTVSMSFVEVAGDSVNDLLNGFESAQLLSASDGSFQAYPVVEPMVSTVDDLLAFVQYACTVRNTQATGVHDASSRSHAILRVYINDESSKREGTYTGDEKSVRRKTQHFHFTLKTQVR